MTTIRVPYGNGFQEAFIDNKYTVETIDIGSKDKYYDEEKMLKEALDNPINSEKLEDMVKKDDKILIVINDHTRPGPTKMIVNEMMERFKSIEIPKENIKFIVATGSHRATTEEELESILGKEIVNNFEIIVHDCKKDLAYLGESKFGPPLYVNQALLECTFCIVTGLIAPHHSAGYSGGRKSILPGLSGFETLKIHHSLPIRPFEPAMGQIYENPFHKVALEAARMVDVKFMINSIQDPHKNNIAFVAGDLEEAHEKGVDICKEISEINLEEKADIVIASPGGSPRDRNLYQSQKALSVAEKIGNPDCHFILVAEGKDGLGEGVLKEWLAEANEPAEVVERFKREGYDIGSNKAFMFARAMLKGKIVVVSEHLDKDELESMMMTGESTLQEAIDNILKVKSPNKIYVLPYAVNIIPNII